MTGCAWLCQGLAPGNAVMVCCSAGAGARGKAKEGREEATHYRLYTLRTAALLSALWETRQTFYLGAKISSFVEILELYD